MISKLFLSVIPAVLFFFTICAIGALLYFFRFSKRGRKSPLTGQLLRGPGESLRMQIEDLSINIDAYIVVEAAIPILVFSTYLSQIFLGGDKQNISSIIIYILIAAIFIALIMIKLWRLLKQRRSLYLALDCELAVGQELNHLMLEGCRVYHDFPADKFNIDHVVVSPKGVFAVETKGRSKPYTKRGGEETKIVYDGEALNFPGWKEKKPLKQARWQATWLSEWLSSAVGEKISVQPVLSFPGWYVDQEKKDDLIFLYGKPTFLAKLPNNEALPQGLIQRIAHQIEQRCRDVEPVAYSHSRKQ